MNNHPSTYPFFLLTLLFVLTACEPPVPIVPKAPTLFNYGRVVTYGACYEQDGLDNPVVMLDVYTPGLRLNKQGKIEGTGLNLCLEDVFLEVTQTRIAEEVYYDTDTTGRANTFLPGRDYEGNVHGAYLLSIQDGTIQSIILLEQGSFVLMQRGDTVGIDFSFIRSDNKSYRAVFYGLLPYVRP